MTLDIQKDVRKDGVISQIVRRLLAVEEWIRGHKTRMHEVYVPPATYVTMLFKGSASLPAINAAAPGTVTVFNEPVPASFLTGDNGLRYAVLFYLDTNANARNITFDLYYDDTVIATSGAVSHAANALRYIYVTGSVLTTGVNTQRGILRLEYNTPTVFVPSITTYAGTGAEDVSTVKNVKLNLTFSGSVDSAILYDATIEMLEDPT